MQGKSAAGSASAKADLKEINSLISKIERESKESDKLILDTLSDQYDAINKRFSKAKKDRDALADRLSKAASASAPAAKGSAADKSKTVLMNQPNMN